VSIRRPAEFHYYDWDFNLWFGSETRANCRALPSEYPMGLLGNAAEGAYRNLLDYCYKHGDIPADIGGLSALSAMSPEVFEMVWPAFSNKFQAHKSKPGRLVHGQVSTRLRAFKQKRKQKVDAGSLSAQKRRTNKSISNNNLDSTPTAEVSDRVAGADHEVRSKKKEVRSISNASAEPESSTCSPEWWVQRLYARHPKKRDKVLVEHAVSALWEQTADPLALFERIDAAHVKRCATNDWQKNNGNYAPKLAEWLKDEAYEPSTATAQEPPETNYPRLP
jgi:hypothetical protein